MSTIKAYSFYSGKLTRRILASGAVGNILETYDLILVSLMATTLSRVFFPPSASQASNIVNVFYVFLVGLLARPIGNVIMGMLSDQVGRKRVMIVSLVFTGLGTMGIGLIPSYQYISIWATCAFIGLRIFQNLFAGIEYINSTAYLIESSNPKTRGYYGSWAAFGISGGYLLASLVALIVFHLVSSGLIADWCWRFIFIFSCIGIAFGIWVRYSIPESLTFAINNISSEQTKKRYILRDSFFYIKSHFLQCASISTLTLLGVYLSYIYYIYIPIYLVTDRGFSQSAVYSLNVVSLGFVVILIPIFGRLSDYYSRGRLLRLVCFSVLLLAVPFFLLAAYGTYHQILFITLIISIPAACFFSIYPVVITQSFPPKIRCTTASLIYQLVVSIEMGTLPLVINYIIKLTRTPYSPGYLLAISALISLWSLAYFDRAEGKND